VHGTQEAVWGPGYVPEDYAGRTALEAASSRIRSLGGDCHVDGDSQLGQEFLDVAICMPGQSTIPALAPVGRLMVERSPDGSATVDSEALESVVAELMQRTSASYSV
jgi:hypothetical protein